MVVKAYTQNIICNPGMLQLLRNLLAWICRQSKKKQLMSDGEIVFIKNQGENYHQVYALLLTILKLRHQRYLLLILNGCIRHLEEKLHYESSYISEGTSYHGDKRQVQPERTVLRLIESTAKKLIWEKYYD